MKADRALATLCSWRFIAALGVLLMNDLLLKARYPGFVTGKLSDFAGIAVLALLLLSAFPRRPVVVYVGIAMAFAWWKSPLSSSFLTWLNGLGFGEFGRTLDYTDLMALSMLPFCRSGEAATKSLSWKRIRAVLAIPVCAVTLLAIMGTSQIPPRQDNFTIRDATARPFERQAVASAIRAVAERHGMSCRNCDNPAGVYFDGDSLRMQYEFTAPNTATFTLWIQTSCALVLWFCSSTASTNRAEAFRASLKEELATRFKDLEYVERLRPW